MKHVATLIYTESLIREAVFGFWRRSVGVGFYVAVIWVAAFLGWLVWRGNSSWVVGVLATVLLFGVLFAATLYVVHYRNAISKLRNMPSKQANFVADEAGFSVESELGSTTMPWSSVIELWRFQTCWLLLFSKAQFITLPLACLSDDMRQFIANRVEASKSANTQNAKKR